MAKGQKPRQPPAGGTQPQRMPYFDRILFELSVDGVVIKRLDIRAVDQRAVLGSLQDDNWAARIDDPLPPHGGDGKARLRSTIHRLNQHQYPPTIHFFADGSGEGIRWEFISPRQDGPPKADRKPPRR